MREAEKEQANPVVTFGHYRLDLKAGQLWRGTQVVKLTPKAFDALCYFVKRAGQLVTKGDLLAAVWPRTVVGAATLASCIQALRRALRDNVQSPRYIETVPRRGYRFIALLITTPPVVSNQFSVLSTDRTGITSPQLVTGNWQLTTHLVGRDAELARLHELLDKALNGERQIVFVTGEPGIGKTTLVDVFLHSLESRVQGPASQNTDPRPQTPKPWLAQGQCIEHYGAGEPYLPLLEALGRLCRQPDGEQIVALLAQHAPTWLVQMPAVLSTEEFVALQRKASGTTQERMLRELAEMLEVLTAERLLVLWLEDLHWGDASTLDWLACIARRREHAKLLVLGTYRPGDVRLTDHPLRAVKQELQLHGQCEELAVDFLTESHVAQYLAGRFPVEAQHAASLQQWAHSIHQRTEGNPLFMVNMVDHLVSQGVLGQVDGQWSVRQENTGATVPENLRQLIERQYERLSPEARHMLDAASVAGVEFSAAAVASGAATTVETVEEHCGELARQNYFLRLSGAQEWPDGIVTTCYCFRHALYQEVLYERLSAGRRQRLHQRIGERIEQGHGDQAREVAAELALHFERGRAYAKAVHYHHQAGENAAQRSALQEAIQHISTGLGLLEHLPNAPERTQPELTLQVTLGELLTTVKGFGVPEVAHAFARAREICRQPGETPQLFRPLLGLWTYYVERAELATAHELAAQLLQLAQSVQSAGLLVWAHLSFGITLHFQGDQIEARRHLEQSLACYDPSRFRAVSAQYDPSVLSHSTLGPVLWLLGYPEQARQQSQKALTLARELPHPYNLVYALNLASRVGWLRGEQDAVRQLQEELTAFSQEQGFASYAALGKVLGGWVVADQGNPEEGSNQMRQNLAAWRATGAESARPYYLAMLAEVEGKAGHPEAGLKVLEEGLAARDRTEGRVFEAELYRLKGELTLKQSSVQRLESRVPSSQPLAPSAQAVAEAEACFLKAFDIARQQQAKSLELRATMSLVRLRQQQVTQYATRTTQHEARNMLAEAHPMLAELYDWFTEGFDAKNLQEAKALLEELA